jgi:hypothetical protein
MDLINEPDDQDKIKILLASGGILEFVNPIKLKDASSSEDPQLYTGKYYINSVNQSGYAVVEFCDSYYDQKIAQYRTDISVRPRLLRYYPGDGLEYVFKEFVVPYGFIKEQYQYSDVGSREVPKGLLPTVFYIEEINSSMGNLLTFKRNRHYANGEIDDLTPSRALITEFGNFKINYTDTYVEVAAFERTLRLFMNIYQKINRNMNMI